MNVLAISSSGCITSTCLIFGDDVISFSISHQRKSRPDWDFLIENVGVNSIISIEEIDIFAFGNNTDSYTATRSVASYLKGVTIALDKALVEIPNPDDKSSDAIAKKALQLFKNSKDKSNFLPENAIND
ncbi:hypothetical protein OA851_02090 [SAR86 cluster bacterium]|nr:hypothetical protein [SAR86 cluster bacterium]